MTPAANRRRDTDKPLGRRAFEFCLSPLVDRYHGISITRSLAIIDTLFAWHVIESGHAISGTELALLTMAMAAAFGKSMMAAFLLRYQVQTAVAQTDTRIESKVDVHEVKEIVARRDEGLGLEATP